MTDEGMRLLPCPFCGSEAQRIRSTKSFDTLEAALAAPPNVRCSNGRCGARYVPGGFLIEEWNRRSAYDAKARECEALRSDGETITERYMQFASLHNDKEDYLIAKDYNRRFIAARSEGGK